MRKAGALGANGAAEGDRRLEEKICRGAACAQKAVHLRLLIRTDEAAMPRQKDETLSIRTSSEVKQLLRLAAEREHRSVASMMEVLILEYARHHRMQAAEISSSQK